VWDIEYNYFGHPEWWKVIRRAIVPEPSSVDEDCGDEVAQDLALRLEKQICCLLHPRVKWRWRMDVHLAEELLNELGSSLEMLETQQGALLQFLKDKGVITDEQFAPYLTQAGNASNVR